jgi:hypothetical protein
MMAPLPEGGAAPSTYKGNGPSAKADGFLRDLHNPSSFGVCGKGFVQNMVHVALERWNPACRLEARRRGGSQLAMVPVQMARRRSVPSRCR